jgi:serine/threonine-protein kinase
MRLLCPSCRTPLPSFSPGEPAVVTCETCAAEVDLSRAGTGAGRPRFVPEIDRLGARIGRFELVERLGAGGMGTVYRAVSHGEGGAAGVAVAVKLLAPALAGDPDIVARFDREVGLLRALAHPGIVRVLEQGTLDGVPWFAMELASGPDLRARLAKGRLAPAEVAAIFPRLCAALGHAHARGVVHRDIKPANVLLAGAGAKLADFGIARPALSGDAAATRLTETAAVIGTLPYMSPEQRAGGALDGRSDLFSIGVVLYEAVTGRLPAGAFPPPSRLNPAFRAAFDRVVARLLQPEPADRFASADDAGRAIAAALRPGWSARRRVAAAAGGLTAALAVATPLLLAPHKPRPASSRPLAAPAAPAANPDPRPRVDPPVPPLPPPPPPGVENGTFGTVAKSGAMRKPSGKLARPSKKMAPDDLWQGQKAFPKN